MEEQKIQKDMAFFAALCLFMAAVEYAIPKPLPFMRIGLANLPILLALPIFKGKSFFFLVVLKVIGQGLISGTLFSYVFLFSVSGSFVAAFAMWGLFCLFKKKQIISYVGISLAGSVFNNFAQLIVARFFFFGEQTSLIAPILLWSGFISGLLLGIFAQYFSVKSKWYALLTGVQNEAT